MSPVLPEVLATWVPHAVFDGGRDCDRSMVSWSGLEIVFKILFWMFSTIKRGIVEGREEPRQNAKSRMLFFELRLRCESFSIHGEQPIVNPYTYL